jgi:hypothetical protein
MTTTQPLSPARIRADRYAKYAPEGATVEITEERLTWIDIAQLTVKGAHETVLITISNSAGKTRTRASVRTRFGGNEPKKCKVRDAIYWVRNVYVPGGER